VGAARLRLAAWSFADGAVLLVAYLSVSWALLNTLGLNRTLSVILALVAALLIGSLFAIGRRRVWPAGTGDGLQVARVRGAPAFIAVDSPAADKVFILVLFVAIELDLRAASQRSPFAYAVLAVACAWLIAHQLIVGRYLVFTAAALWVPSGLWRAALPWDALSALPPHPNEQRHTTIDIHRRGRHAGWHRIRTGRLVADQGLVYEAIRHYIAHREARSAIGDPNELDRLRASRTITR
jgi:hypothetical protein